MQPDCSSKSPITDAPPEPIYPTSSHMHVIAAPKDALLHDSDTVTGASENPRPDWAACVYTGLLACNDFRDEIIGGYEWSSRQSPRVLPSSTITNLSEPEEAKASAVAAPMRAAPSPNNVTSPSHGFCPNPGFADSKGTGQSSRPKSHRSP